MQNRINIPNELKKMDSIFQKHGFNAYLVGGAVRDIIEQVLKAQDKWMKDFTFYVW